MEIASLRRSRTTALAILLVIGLVSISVAGAGLAAPSGSAGTPTPTPTPTPTDTGSTGDSQSNSGSQSNDGSPSRSGSQSDDTAGSQQSDPPGTMGSVTITITTGSPSPYIISAVTTQSSFQLRVTKLNTTTFVVKHIHGGTTKRWFFPNNSTTHPNFNENHVNDLWQTNQRAGWPGRLGEHTDKGRLKSEIKDTEIYRTKILPFIGSETHQQKPPKVDQPGPLDDIPSFDPVENFRALVEALMGFAGGIVTTALDWIFGVPAPGKPTKPTTWLTPTNGIWGGIADFTKWTTGFATLLLAYSGGMSFLRTDVTMRRQDWKRWGFALVMILGTWTLLPLGLHIANEVSQVVRPGTAEMFRSWASISKVGVGLGFLTILAVLQQSILGIGIFVLAIERVIIFITVGFWPLAWALRSTRNDIARSLGQLCVFLLAMMIATKLGQAFMARLLFSLDWNLGSAGLGEIVIMLLTIGAGVAFMLIYFPLKMLQHANDAANVSLGMSAAAKASGRASEWAGERASERIKPHLTDKYESLRDWRDSDPESSIPEHKRQVGQVGRDRADSERTDDSSSGADGGFDAFDPTDEYQRHRHSHSKRYQRHVDDLNSGND